MSSSRSSHDLSSAHQAAIRFVRGRVKSRAELRAHLACLGMSSAVVDQVVAGCQRRGLIDDGACARLWAEHYARRGYAWVAIRDKLTAKGLPAAALDAAASTLQAAGDVERARELVSRRLTSGSPQRRQVARILAVRGYDQDVIERVLEESLGPLEP